MPNNTVSDSDEPIHHFLTRIVRTVKGEPKNPGLFGPSRNNKDTYEFHFREKSHKEDHKDTLMAWLKEVLGRAEVQIEEVRDEWNDQLKAEAGQTKKLHVRFVDGLTELENHSLLHKRKIPKPDESDYEIPDLFCGFGEQCRMS